VPSVLVLRSTVRKRGPLPSSPMPADSMYSRSQSLRLYCPPLHINCVIGRRCGPAGRWPGGPVTVSTRSCRNELARQRPLAAKRAAKTRATSRHTPCDVKRRIESSGGAHARLHGLNLAKMYSGCPYAAKHEPVLGFPGEYNGEDLPL